MIAINIGKTFLSAYNQKFGKQLSAREFFEQEFYPLFYDHPKYMQWITNSPFVQGIKKGIYPNSVERNEKFNQFIQKIESNIPDASIAIGFPSLDLTATTSGQITNIDIGFDEEDVFYSWIGGGFGIGVQGGLVIYFDEPEILLKLYDGWHLYREFLNEIDKLRPNQIDTWNGQWLAHVLNKGKFISENPTAHFTPFKTNKTGVIELETQKWVKVLVRIAQHYPNQTLTGYIFSLGQMNTTIGFVPFYLPQILKPIHYYRKLFGDNEFLRDGKIVEELLGCEFSLRQSCMRGQIGIEAMQPKGLMPFIKLESEKHIFPQISKNPVIKKNSSESTADFEKSKRKLLENYNEQVVKYKTYEGWLMAALDNFSLYEKATKYAQCFIHYEKGASRGRTNRSQHVKQALTSKSRRNFIDSLTEIIQEEMLHELNDLVLDVIKMPADNFQYFLTLLRFRYYFLSKNEEVSK